MGKYLLDTSIQVKRLAIRKWKIEEIDKVWEEITPIVSSYTLMEFKNSLIKSYEYLISIINEVKDEYILRFEDNQEIDFVRIRLEDVVRQLSETNQRISDRKIKLILGIACEVLKENSLYPRLLSPDEVITSLIFKAEDLENYWFFWYPKNRKCKKATMVNTTRCYLSYNLSPVKDGINKFKCLKGKYPCEILNYCVSDRVQETFDVISEKKTYIDSRKLRSGVFKFKESVKKKNFSEGLSIGQRSCWPLGDAVIFSKCLNSDFGIFSADSDLRHLALFFKKAFIYLESNYKLHFSSIKGLKGRGA
jgi:hypothetical protein